MNNNWKKLISDLENVHFSAPEQASRRQSYQVVMGGPAHQFARRRRRSWWSRIFRRK